MKLSRILATAAVAAATMFGAAAPGSDTAWFGAGFGREAAAATTITDQLTNRRSTATRRNGGTFTAEGWKVTDPAAGGKTGAYLMYALPAGTTSGSVEFEAKGFRFQKYPDGSSVDNREHVWGVYDKDVSHESENRVSGYLLRLYDHRIPDGTFFAGAHRFRFISPETTDIDTDKKARTAWSSTKWYKLRFEWSQTQARWFKDGVLQSTVSTRNLGRSYRFVYVGSDFRSEFLVPPGVTYRNVRVTGNK